MHRDGGPVRPRRRGNDKVGEYFGAIEQRFREFSIVDMDLIVESLLSLQELPLHDKQDIRRPHAATPNFYNTYSGEGAGRDQQLAKLGEADDRKALRPVVDGGESGG